MCSREAIDLHVLEGASLLAIMLNAQVKWRLMCILETSWFLQNENAPVITIFSKYYKFSRSFFWNQLVSKWDFPSQKCPGNDSRHLSGNPDVWSFDWFGKMKIGRKSKINIGLILTLVGRPATRPMCCSQSWASFSMLGALISTSQHYKNHEDRSN